MSLQTRITALAQAIGADVKALLAGLAGKAPAVHTHSATSITNVPAGGVTATNMQAAVDELDTKKLPKSGGTMTGSLTLPANGLVVGSNQIVASGGNVGLGAAVPRAPLHSFNAANFGAPDTTGTGVTGVSARIQGGSVNLDLGVYSSGNLWIQGRLNTDNATTFQLVLNPVGGPVLVGSGGLGYATGIGAGGSVAQATNKSTSVTLNKPSGQITMSSENLAAGAAVRFYVYNDKVTSASTVGCAVDGSTPNALEYEAKAIVVGSGYFVVRLSNVAGSGKATSVLINFAVALGSAS